MKADDILRALEGDRSHSGTHMHVIGSSGVGKSYLLDYLLREAVLSPTRGFCFIDPHGTTYDRLLNFIAHIRPRRPVILLNPSEPRYVVGFNPFMSPGEDITTTVGRRVDATVKPWGAQNTNPTPTLERTAKMAYHFAVRAGETLPNTALLLRFAHRNIADYASSILREPEDDEVREDIDELRMSRTAKEWGDKVLSTKNRFARFVGHTGLQTFLGLKEGNIDIQKLIEQNAIILVNLRRSGYLDFEPARVFASLLINEFREAAMRRAGTRKHFFLALDEFQEYITFDLPAMLDETRKGGIHLIMAHQRLGQLENDAQLQDAIFTNAQVKAVFGGLPYKSATIMANEMFLDRINERDIKETFYGQKVIGYDVSEYESESVTGSESSSESHSSDERETVTASGSASTTKTRQRVSTPIYGETVTSRSEWNREEKVSRLAAVLRNQPRQNCAIKMPGQKPVQFVVPDIPDHATPEAVETYTVRTYESLSALPLAEARLAVQKSREDFLSKAKPRRNNPGSSNRPKL